MGIFGTQSWEFQKSRVAALTIAPIRELSDKFGSANSVGQMCELVRQFLVVRYFDVCCVFWVFAIFSLFYFSVYFYSATVANKLHVYIAKSVKKNL